MLGYTRRHLFMALAVTVCVVGIVWLALAILIPAPPSKITIAGSFKGGHYQSLALRYKAVLARAHVAVDVRTTGGAMENLRLLNDPNSGIQIAFVQGGVANDDQAPDLLSLGRIDYQVFWLFYHADETLSDLTELRGKRIAVGPLGSGTRIVSQKILEVGGVTSENTTLVNLTPQRAAEALSDGSIDAVFLNFSPDSPILDGLLKNPKFRPMSFSDAEALTRIFPFLVRLVMPRGVIDYQNKVPAADVILIATTNAVLVRKEIHPAIIDLLAQTIMEVHSSPGIFQRIGEFPTQADPEYPMAEEARDFYRNGPSLLNRYLPFWITNYVKRGIALLVAVIAIIIPMFSYGPNLYRWLVQYRMRALYRRLRVIEATLQTAATAPEIAALEGEVESLDRAIHGLGVPVKHSDLYFTLKSHLNLVRIRVGSRHTELRGKRTTASLVR
ncbi:MAG: TAXI family TRAP transporter solute-binding subunit [Xanthobacteraceae bacterium]